MGGGQVRRAGAQSGKPQGERAQVGREAERFSVHALNPGAVPRPSARWTRTCGADPEARPAEPR